MNKRPNNFEIDRRATEQLQRPIEGWRLVMKIMCNRASTVFVKLLLEVISI